MKELVKRKNDNPITTSKLVAWRFDKEHKNVLADIRNIKDKCSTEFWQLNFQPSKYNSRGKEYPEYIMTKDGFTMLVMGYTGKEAMEFKEDYIKRFNNMERFITSRNLAKMKFPALTENIKLIHEQPKNYHYSNECDLINRIVLGKTAKQFKIDHNIDLKEGTIREYLTKEQIYYIEKIQNADVGMVIAIPDFQDRKKALTNYYNMLKSNKTKMIEE
jgi:Rha family phage regulatory protein